MFTHGESVGRGEASGKRPLPEPGQAVGARLRSHRAALGWSLRAVAEHTGISRSTLSRLEHGQRRASLELLVPLADLYATSIDALIGRAFPSESGPATGGPRPWTVLPLTMMSDASGLAVSKIVLRAGTVAPEPVVHDGHEWFAVLSGRVRLVLAGREYELGAGETAEFATTTPHWFGTATTGPAEIISVFGRTGRRFRPRVSS